MVWLINLVSPVAKSGKSDDGFTIIELLIVLAVAGVVFLIIFNAIPALLRNGRNNQRKQDVAAVLSAISHYQLNHSGSFPPLRPPVPTPPTDDFLYYTKLSFYDSNAVTANPQTAIMTVQDDAVDVYNFELCNTNNDGAVGDNAGYRDIVALYRIEIGGSTAVRCQQL